MAKKDTAKRVEATKLSLRILDTVSRLGTASATEIAEEMEVAKSTAHYHLKTLEDAGYIHEDTGYRVGLKSFHFGHKAVSELDIYQVGKSKVDQLAAQTGELCILMVEENGSGYYIYDQSGSNGVNFDTIGSKKYLHNNALGKAVLSLMTDEQISEILSQSGLPATTTETITNESELVDEIEVARRDGVAYDYEEQLDGLCCVAAPVELAGIDDKIDTLGAISLAVPNNRADGSYFTDELSTAVSDAAGHIKLELQDY